MPGSTRFSRIRSIQTLTARHIIQALQALGLEKSDDGAFAVLRQNRGRLVKRPRGGGLEIVANGRGDWIGWVELEREEVNEVATANTARIIRDVGADMISRDRG